MNDVEENKADMDTVDMLEHRVSDKDLGLSLRLILEQIQ